MVGLPGAGKTTRARQIEVEHRAVRLTPDEWIMPLFGDPEPEDKRDVLEGRFVWLALRSLRLGMNVVLDFGVWGRDERMALRALAASVGASCELVYLEIGPDEQKRRTDQRFRADPDATFGMSEDDLERSILLFQAPDPGELDARGDRPASARLRRLARLGGHALADVARGRVRRLSRQRRSGPGGDSLEFPHGRSHIGIRSDFVRCPGRRSARDSRRTPRGRPEKPTPVP